MSSNTFGLDLSRFTNFYSSHAIEEATNAAQANTEAPGLKGAIINRAQWYGCSVRCLTQAIMTPLFSHDGEHGMDHWYEQHYLAVASATNRLMGVAVRTAPATFAENHPEAMKAKAIADKIIAGALYYGKWTITTAAALATTGIVIRVAGLATRLFGYSINLVGRATCAIGAHVQSWGTWAAKLLIKLHTSAFHGVSSSLKFIATPVMNHPVAFIALALVGGATYYMVKNEINPIEWAKNKWNEMTGQQQPSRA